MTVMTPMMTEREVTEDFINIKTSGILSHFKVVSHAHLFMDSISPDNSWLQEPLGLPVLAGWHALENLIGFIVGENKGEQTWGGGANCGATNSLRSHRSRHHDIHKPMQLE